MPILKPTPKPKGESAALSEFYSGSGFGSAGGAYVYMGTGRQPATAQDEKYGRAPRKLDLWATEDEAKADFYNWDGKRQGDFLAKAIVGGLLKFGDGPMEAGKLWAKLVKEAFNYGKAGKKVTPFDLMAAYVGAAGGSGKNAWQSMGAFEVNIQTGEKRYVGPGTYLGNGVARQTDTRTDLTDPDTARAVATRLFQEMMGRDPGAGELSAFASALHTAEANNPVTQTTDTTYNMETGQPLSTSTQTSGGMTAEGRALIGENQIKSKKEYGVNQAVTTYQSAFENLIFGAPE